MKEQNDLRGRPMYTFDQIRGGRYSRIVKNLARRFKLQPEGKTIDTADNKLQEYSDASRLVSLEWETTSGFSVVSRNAESDQLTTDIAHYVHKKYRA